MYGITSFSAVINPPQACILAVGAGIQKVLPPKPSAHAQKDAGSKQPRPRVVTTVTVQLSADRRVVDEATAAQFLQASCGNSPSIQVQCSMLLSVRFFFSYFIYCRYSKAT